MSESTIEQYSSLAGLLAWRTHPILPQPHWGQDVAFVAFIIDGLWDEIIELRAFIQGIAEQDPMSLEVVGQGPLANVCMYCDAVQYDGDVVTHDAACIWQCANDVLASE